MGYQYLRARYYDPATGRFISKDPFAGLLGSPKTQSPYSYVLNNPINHVDPSGLTAEPPGGPPVPVPDGGPENGWEIKKSPRGADRVKWGPRVPVPGQSQPQGSWDPYGEGHWDIDDGCGTRRRYDRWGVFLPHEQAHRPFGRDAQEGNQIVSVISSFADDVSESTGLVGGALALYMFVSVVSRLYPPRNLVPIP